MNKRQIKGRVKAVQGRIKEVTGKLIGNEALAMKGTAEKIAADKKVLYEDLRESLRKLA